MVVGARLRSVMLILTILPTKRCIFPAYVKVHKNLPTSSEKSALHSQRRRARCASARS